MALFSNIFAKDPKSKDKDTTSFKDQLQALNNLPRFFKMVWKTSPFLFISNILLRLIKAALPLIMLYVGKLIIDEVIFQIAQESGGELRQLWIYVGIELGLALFSDLLNRLINLTDSLLGDLFSNYTSVELIRHAARLDMVQFEDPTFYDKLERARRHTVGRVVLISQVLTQVQDVITILFLAGGLIAFNPWLLIILIIAVIPSFLGESYFNSRNYSISRSWTPERRELDYIRYIGASDVTAKEVKTSNLSDFLANRYEYLADKYYLVNKSLSSKRAIWGSVFSGVGTLSYYGAYVLIIIQTVTQIITVGDMTFLSGSFNRMRNLLQTLMTRFSSIAESSLYLKDLFDFLALEPNIISKQKAIPFPEKIKEGIEFRNVSFQYPGSHQYAIKDLSFKIRAGEKLALVGENGAGKTTFVKLLSRLYEPTEGAIYLDGVDLRDYNLESLRQNIGIIFQDYVRFQMKASENIAVGEISKIEDQERIIGSANKSLANEVIDNLADNYDQMLGKRFKGGVELSGGQWQKIALARAYMGDSQIMILDEPTSALDARAEHEVFQRFSKLIEGKMAILISHRFSTVRMADRILFLEYGQVKEYGSHDELIAQNGQYAELFNLQAQGYM